MSKKILTYLNKILTGLEKGFIKAFFARLLSALGSVFLLFVLGRVYGANGVGLFAICQSIVIGASILSRFGMDNALIRFVGQQPLSGNVGIYMRWAVVKSLKISILVAITVWFFSNSIAKLFSSSSLESLLVGFSLSIPAVTLSFILSGFMKGVRKPVSSCLMENGMISFFAGGLVAILHIIFGTLSFNCFSWLYALSAWVTLLIGAVVLLFWRKGAIKKNIVRDDLVSRKKFDKSSVSFFYLGVAMFMQSALSIWIAAYFLDEGELGLFKAAWQAATLLGFVQIVINTIYPPRFAEAYYKSDFKELSRLAKSSSLVGVVLVFPLFVAFIVFPVEVLSIIGKDFKAAAPLLVIISLGQMVNVASGSVGYLLNMTNNESLMRNIAIICNMVGLVVMFIAVPKFGEVGAAISVSLILILQNTVAVFYVYKKLGIFMFPLLSGK